MPLSTNPFDATFVPPPIPKTAVPISSGTDWTDEEAKLTKGKASQNHFSQNFQMSKQFQLDS